MRGHVKRGRCVTLSKALSAGSFTTSFTLPALGASTTLLAPILLAPSLALAAPNAVSAASTDGAYGRFRGDTELSVAAGPEFTKAGPRLRAELQAHYFWSAGAYVSVSQELSTPETEASLLGLGVSFRPAFLPRFGLDLEQGPARMDLFLDSISLSLGGYYGVRAASGAHARGLEAALSFALPLMADAEGLWLAARLGMRLPDDPDAPNVASAALLLSYRWLWTSPAAAR